jgi:hypothetical protein
MFALAMMVAGWLGVLHTGGWINVLQPSHAALALSLAVAYSQLRGLGQVSPRLIAAALACVQLFILRFERADHLPSPWDRSDGWALVEQLRGVHGPIYAPDTGIYPWLAGHPMHVHAIAVEDLLRGGQNEGLPVYQADFRRALESRRFGAGLFGDREIRGSQSRDFRRHFPTIRRVRGAKTMTGMECRPFMLVLPQQPR